MVIRVDWDYGFEPHRQFGRGKTGGQVRDEVRQNAGRSGDADRPVINYSHHKREYSHRRGGGYRGGYGGGGDDGDGHGHGGHGNQGYEGRSYLGRKRNFRDRYGGRNDGGDEMQGHDGGVGGYGR